jgi:hypothetical protein
MSCLNYRGSREKSAEQIKRDQKICQLSEMGYASSILSQRFGLSAGRVANIVRQVRERGKVQGG